MFFFITTGNDDTRAFFGEQPGDAFAHSRAGACDNGDFIFQTIHFPILRNAG
jgi:hypothetical protein